MIRADIRFRSPTLTKPAESPNPASQPTPAAAHWQPVKLQLGWTPGFDQGDCLLVDQFRLQVLKYFDVRNLTSDLVWRDAPAAAARQGKPGVRSPHRVEGCRG